MYLNQVTIIGNLTRDPELRSLPSGVSVASFSVATNETYKNKDGNKVESVEFHNCVAFGKAGELIAQYMKKGSHILVQGKLQTRSWEGKEGGKQYRTEINVRDFKFGRKSSNPQSDGFDDQRQEHPVEQSQDVPTTNGIEYPADDINPDDIPF